VKSLIGLRILALSIATTSLLIGAVTSSENRLSSYLQNQFSNNPNIKGLRVEVIKSENIPNSQDWKAVKLRLSGQFKQGSRYVPFSENQVFFTDGKNFTNSLTSLNGDDWKQLFTPKIEQKHYSPSHLLYGNSDAKHKIVVFSDPLCPYCKRNVPPLLNYVKKYPKTFAVYYYHLPLERIHPASVPLAKLMYMAQIRGDKEAIIKAYNTYISPRESDTKKILDAFNRATGLHYSERDLNSPLATRAIQHDKSIANELEVRGTPTIYFDGKKSGGDFYKRVKIVD